MTLQELSNHFKLREQLDIDVEMLESLRAAAYPKAQALTGMPHASGYHDKVGDLAIEITDMEERIRHLREEVKNSETQITEFIITIKNDYVRTLFRLRFMRGLTWGQVAAVVGGRNTEDGVKSACYRYLSTLK